MSERSVSGRTEWRVELDDYVHALEVSPTHGLAVAGSLGGDACILETESGDRLALDRHDMGVLSAAWSGDGNRVAVGGQDGIVRTYESDGTPAGVVPAASWVSSAAWSPVAPMLAVGAGRHLLVVDQDGAVLHDFDDQRSTVTGVAWTPDGTRVGASAYGGSAWYQIVGGDVGSCLRFDMRGSLLSLAVSPVGTWACAGAQDANAQLWKLWSGEDIALSGYAGKVEKMGFRHDGRWLAIACLGDLSVWDFGGEGPVGTRPSVVTAHAGHLEDLAWDPSGRTIATGGGDRRAVVWTAPDHAGDELRPVAAVESDADTSRLSWIDDQSLLIGRADGAIVRFAID